MDKCVQPESRAFHLKHSKQGTQAQKQNLEMTSFLEMGADNRDGKQRSGQILQCPRQGANAVPFNENGRDQQDHQGIMAANISGP
jgi:hypothetical protein